MDFADDIAYAVGDIEDYYRVGLVDFSALMINRPERLGELERAFADDADRMDPSGEYPGLNPRDPAGQFYGYARRRVREWVRKLGEPDMVRAADESFPAAFSNLGGGDFGDLVLPVIPYDGSSAGKLSMHVYASSAIERFLSGFSLDDENGLVVNHQTRIEVEILKKLARFYTYDRPSIRIQQAGQAAALRACFFLFFDMCSGYFLRVDGVRDTHFSIPGRLYEYCILALDERKDNAQYTTANSAVARGVCDYLCTLTDHSVLAIADALREGRGDILNHLGSL